MSHYLLNTFNLQMLVEFPASVQIEEIPENEGWAMLADVQQFSSIPERIFSAIDNADMAAVLGVPMNRIKVTLRKGDIALVAQLQGGQLPEGSVVLPDGFYFKFLLVAVKL